MQFLLRFVNSAAGRDRTETIAVTNKGVGALRVLLIDDDVSLCSLMADFFASREIQLECAHDGRTGLSRALSEMYALVILDIMLPAFSGFQVLEQIRRRSSVPVIMLTARVDEQDRVAGLNAGADDYLPKPFGPDELLARIHAVLRRGNKLQTPAAPRLKCGTVHLDSSTREVSRDGQPISLTAIEFDILQHLMRSAGRVVSRDEMTIVLYQRQATPYERALDVHVSHLRKKLNPVERPLIYTVRGVGYLLAGSVESL